MSNLTGRRSLFVGVGDPHVYWRNFGRYLGYAECCIDAFLREDFAHDGPFDGTGFRPCRACHALPPEEVLAGIARRRQHHEPFPVHAGLTEAVRRSFYGT